MKTSINLDVVYKFLSTYHATTYVVAIVLIFAGVIFSLYQIITETLDQPIQTNENTVIFDKEVIDKINLLRESSENDTEVIYPEARSNPFIE